MEEEKRTLTSKDISTKKQKRKSIFKTHRNDWFETTSSNWMVKLRVISFVIFATISSMTIAAKINFTAVVSHALSNHFNNTFPVGQLDWIGRLYPITVLCLFPITTSVIDHWMLSYRFSLVIAGSLHLIGCITSSTVIHPLFFVLTDSLVCGLGSAVTFSVFFLAIDDIFPKGHKLRVFVTTLCQGSTIFSLFIPEILAYVAKDWGWLIFQISLAVVFGLEAAMLIINCPEYGFNVRVKRRGGPSEEPSLSDWKKSDESDLKMSNKLLGLTFVEINRSPSMFPLLVYKFAMSIIYQGITLLVLLDSQIITTPHIDVLVSKYFHTTTAALVFASGETIMFLTGAIVGVFILGYLLHISIFFLCVLFLVTVIWQPIRLQMMSQSMVIGHIVCAAITGGCIGALSTCATTLSEEATTIQSRRIYPFVKLLEGLAYTFAPFLFKILNTVSDKNIWLLTFSVMAAANACLLVFILHKLYVSYKTNPGQHKTTMQVSMKPVNLFVRKSDSN